MVSKVKISSVTCIYRYRCTRSTGVEREISVRFGLTALYSSDVLQKNLEVNLVILYDKVHQLNLFEILPVHLVQLCIKSNDIISFDHRRPIVLEFNTDRQRKHVVILCSELFSTSLYAFKV